MSWTSRIPLDVHSYRSYPSRRSPEEVRSPLGAATNKRRKRGDRRLPARERAADQRRVLPAAGARKNWQAVTSLWHLKVLLLFGARTAVLPRATRRRAGTRIRTQRPRMGWAGNRVAPQITAAPRFPVGSRVLLKPADPKGRKKGMFVDCAGVVISVQETTTKYALRKLWRGVPVQRAYVYCVKTAGGVYATAAETALRRSLDDERPVARPSPSDVVVGKEPI